MEIPSIGNIPWYETTPGYRRGYPGEPKLLLLDEPTNALDTKGVELLRSIIQEERRRGAAVVVACHDAVFLESVSDEIYCLENGQLTDHLILREKGEMSCEEDRDSRRGGFAAGSRGSLVLAVSNYRGRTGADFRQSVLHWGGCPLWGKLLLEQF